MLGLIPILRKKISIVPKLNLIKNIGDDVKSGENPKKL